MEDSQELTAPAPVAPVALSAEGLRRLAAEVVRPMYWAGPKGGLPLRAQAQRGPNSNYQAEAYDPSPERALVVARSGDVRPVG